MPRQTYFAETPEKQNIRQQIAKQFKTWVRQQKSIGVSMLPGRKGELEKELLKIAKPFKSKTFHFAFFERFREVAKDWWWRFLPVGNEKRQHINCDCYIGCGTFGDFDYLTNYEQPKLKSFFSWADYCGTPLATEIQKFTNAIRKGDVIYLTFYLIPRFRETIDEDCLKALELPPHQRPQAMIKTLENMIRKKIGDNFTRILDKSYNNGDGRSPMMTVGWHFKKDSNLPKALSLMQLYRHPR